MIPHLKPNLSHYRAAQKPPVYLKTGPTFVVRRSPLWGLLALLGVAFSLGFAVILLVLSLNAQ